MFINYKWKTISFSISVSILHFRHYTFQCDEQDQVCRDEGLGFYPLLSSMRIKNRQLEKKNQLWNNWSRDRSLVSDENEWMNEWMNEWKNFSPNPDISTSDLVMICCTLIVSLKLSYFLGSFFVVCGSLTLI